MSLAADIRAMIRREILRALAADPGYAQNDAILRRMLASHAAQTLTESELRAHLSWLEDRGVVVTEHVGPYVTAKLTDHGLKVAAGEEAVEGIRRPRPSELD